MDVLLGPTHLLPNNLLEEEPNKGSCRYDARRKKEHGAARLPYHADEREAKRPGCRQAALRSTGEKNRTGPPDCRHQATSPGCRRRKRKGEAPPGCSPILRAHKKYMRPKGCGCFSHIREAETHGGTATLP
jgi:hypothetical protein